MYVVYAFIYLGYDNIKLIDKKIIKHINKAVQINSLFHNWSFENLLNQLMSQLKLNGVWNVVITRNMTAFEVQIYLGAAT